MRVVAASPPSAWPASEGKPNVMEWKSAGTRNLAYWFFAGTSEFFDGLLKGLTHSTASSTDFSLPRAGTARVRGRTPRRSEGRKLSAKVDSLDSAMLQAGRLSRQTFDK